MPTTAATPDDLVPLIARLAKLEAAVFPPPPVPPTPTPVVLGLPSPGLSTAHPQWADYAARINAAVAGHPAYASGLIDWAYFWDATGRTDAAVKALCLTEFRSQLGGSLARWNGGLVLSEWPAAFAYDSYLYVGDVVTSWCLVLGWMGDALTAQEKADAGMILDQAVTNVWNPDGATWGGKPFPWGGWAVTDPGNNYFYSFFEATLSWALTSGKQAWMDKMTALCAQLETYFADKVGGGSLEGTSYGQSFRRLFRCLWLWKQATGRAVNVRVLDHLRYWVRATTVDYKSVPALGDQSRVSYPLVYDYLRAVVAWGVRLAPATTEAAYARHWLTAAGRNAQDSFNFWQLLFDSSGPEVLDTARSYQAAAAGHFFATDGATDLCVACGPAIEGHAHEDQGEFQLYMGGRWVLATANIWSHSGIRSQVSLHNCVTFRRPDGTVVPQRRWDPAARCPMATADDGTTATAVCDLRPAYALDTGVHDCARRVQWDRVGRRLTVTDSYALIDRTPEFRLTTNDLPTVAADGSVTAGPVTIRCRTAGAVATVTAWPTIEPAEFPGAAGPWLVAFTGGPTGYLVEVTW